MCNLFTSMGREFKLQHTYTLRCWIGTFVVALLSPPAKLLPVGLWHARLQSWGTQGDDLTSLSHQQSMAGKDKPPFPEKTACGSFFVRLHK